ncbi:MAG: SpaA isopeptide-forming pilin-related protein, partial [Erysipelotrichales bacterium]
MKVHRKIVALIAIIGIALSVALPIKSAMAQNIDTNATKDEKKIETKTNTLGRSVISDNIFTGVQMKDGKGNIIKTKDTVINGGAVEIDLEFSFSGKNYKENDTFETQLPSQLNFVDDLSGIFTGSDNAKWEVNKATNKLTITFTKDNVTNANYKLNLVTPLHKAKTVEDGSQKLVYTTSPNVTIYELDYLSDYYRSLDIDLKADEVINPAEGTITGTYNLKREISKDLTYVISGEQSPASSLNLKDTIVQYSDIDFAGKLVGNKITMVEGVDYEIIYTGQNGNNPELEVKLKKDIGRKAIIVTTKLSNLELDKYSDPNSKFLKSNHINAMATIKKNGQMSTTLSAEGSAYAGQPLLTKGKKNEDTGNIDWEIIWNFNEKELNINDKLISVINDNGIKYVDGSFKVSEVDLVMDPFQYTYINEVDVTNDYTFNMQDNGSFELNPNKKNNKARIIRYSTKIIDQKDRTIKNNVTYKDFQSEGVVDLDAKIFKKEKASVDIYNQTMLWDITVNESKINMSNVYVHDYFLGAAKDLKSLKVHVINDKGEKVKELVEGTDYKKVEFGSGEYPSPGEKAPQSYNGGVRVNLIGEYTNLKDTIIISLETNLDVKNSSEDSIKIKNYATLNYDGFPGIIEYEAEGDYPNLFINGGVKKVYASYFDSDVYTTQDWLIGVNLNKNNTKLVKVDDYVPDYLEIIPESLRFDEIVSIDMLNNINDYILKDNKLASSGDAVYPTNQKIENNKISLEFGNLKDKGVLVKFNTRYKKGWASNKTITNQVTINSDGKENKYEADTDVFSFLEPIDKTVKKDSNKKNVLNWTNNIKNVLEDREIKDPIISDEIKNDLSDAVFDTTSFKVRETESNKEIDPSKYTIEFEGKKFKITFKDYTLTKNIYVTYDTVSKKPGTLVNYVIIDSDSFGELLAPRFREKLVPAEVSFSTGTGTGIVELGGFELSKVAAGNNDPLSGAVFEILTEDGSSTNLRKTTGADGKIIFDNIPLGNYKIKEIQAPVGYKINDEYKEGKAITISKEANEHKITVENTKEVIPTGNVELHKTIKDSTDKLAGAEFKLVDSQGATIHSGLVTDESGKIIVNALEIGEYAFIETKAPTGYLLDATPHKFTIVENQTTNKMVDVTNSILKVGSVKLTKIDEDTRLPMPNVKFDLYKADTTLYKGNLTTNAQGVIIENNMPAGDYYFVEQSAPEGYVFDGTLISFKIKVDNTEVVELTKTNKVQNIDIEGTKSWVGDSEATRPENVTIRLFAGADEINNVQTNKAKSWKYKFENLPVYNAGEKIKYSIKEDKVAEYTTTYNKYDVINTLSPSKVSYKVTKKWVDGENQDGKRASQVEVKLKINDILSNKVIT